MLRRIMIQNDSKQDITIRSRAAMLQKRIVSTRTRSADGLHCAKFCLQCQCILSTSMSTPPPPPRPAAARTPVRRGRRLRTTREAAPPLPLFAGNGPGASVDDRICATIHEAVLDHRLPPGTKLKEVALAEIF